MNQRSIEVRVGALLVLSTGLFGAFILLLSGLSFEPTYRVFVTFQNPGGLVAGAPVRISGVKVGRVSELEFQGTLDRRPSDGTLIRAEVKLEKRYQSAIHDDSRWFVTAEGVIGEPYLAVDPGTPARPPLAEGATVRGVSPPRLDLLLSEGYELLHQLYRGLSGNDKKIGETLDGLHRTLDLTANLLEQNGPRLARIAENVEVLSSDAASTLKAARERYVDGPQVTRIMNDLERTARATGQDLPLLLQDGRLVVGDARRITRALSGDQELGRIEAITRDAGEAAAGARALVGDARSVMATMKAGRGTAGALLADEALYDDLSELVRDLKHNPWKLIWKQ